MISTEVESTVHNSYDVVVLAADGLLGAVAVASNTNDGERRALETDVTSDAAGVDAQETQEGRDGVLVSLRDTVRIVALHK